MNKLLQKLAKLTLGLAMAAGVGVAIGAGRKDASPVHGAAGEVAYTMSTPQSSGNTGYGNTYDVTIGGITWNAPGNQNFSGYWRIGGASISGVNRVITGKTAINKPISKITVNHSGRSADTVTLNSCTVTVASDSTFETIIESKTVTSGLDVSTAGSFDIAGTTTSTWVANSYYKITFNVTKSNSGNGGFHLASIVFYEGTSGGGGTANNDFVIQLNDKSLANATSYQQAQTTSNYDGGACTADLAWNKINPSSGQLAGNKTTQSNLQATGDYNFSIRNTTAFPRAIKSITIDGIGGGGTCTASKAYAQVSSSNITNQTTANSTAGTAGTNKITWTFTGTSTYFALGAINGFTSSTVTAEKITITLEEEAEEPTVSISTTSTDVVWNGTSTQTIPFEATVDNFSDDAEDIAYEWRSSNASAISVTSVGSDSTANLKVVGAGNATITCYALGLSGDEATSEGVQISVTNETYSGSLSITTSGEIQIDSVGNIEYTLTGNTHAMNTFNIATTDDDVIAVEYNSSTGKFDYVAGSTANATATVTITLSSSVYTLETYQQTLSVRLVDANAVSSVTTNLDTRNVKFGGSSLSFTATVTLVGGGDATGKQVTWTPTDSGVCTITPSANTLVGTVVPVNVGSTTVRVASVDDPTKYHDVTVNVAAPDEKTLNSITITKGDGYKQTYYDTATEVDLTGLSLTANYINSNYPTYSENVAVANDASGVTWTLDKTNQLVKVSYIVSAVEAEDSFSVTITEEPAVKTITSSLLGIADQTDASGSYTVSPFTVTFAQNEGSNPPKYYTNGTSVRMYNENTLVISCDASVESIDSIVITVDSSKTDFDISTNVGGTCSGSGLEYTFTSTTEITFTAGSNQFRPQTIEIAYTKVAAVDKDVESVEVTPSSVSVEAGKTTNLSVEVLPADARDLSVTWESDDEEIATVDENGVVTGVAPGTATITATSNDQDSISDSATVTVTAGPVIEYHASSAINDESGSQVYLGNAYFDLTVEGGTYRGSEARGAAFSSGKTAVDVGFKLIDIAVATQDLRVIIDASRNANGTATLGVKLGSSDLECDSETSVILTGTSTEYEFVYSGSASSTVSLSNLLDISLSNDGGAIYIKTIKVYSAASKSAIGEFTTNSLRMNSYDEGGTEGSTKGDGSCKVWWNDVLTSYNGLTSSQKTLFSSIDQYSSARARLSEWARINGYTFNSANGTLSKSPIVNPLAIITNNNTNTIAIIVIISMVSVGAIGGYFFIRKRKEN